MLTKFSELRRVLKLSKTPVFRDDAPSGHNYPYIIYEFVNDDPNFASNAIIGEYQTYQISYITEGIESELSELKQLFKDNKILHSGFGGGPYDENDKSITQFNTYVRCRDEQ